MARIFFERFEHPSFDSGDPIGTIREFALRYADFYQEHPKTGRLILDQVIHGGQQIKPSPLLEKRRAEVIEQSTGAGCCTGHRPAGTIGRRAVLTHAYGDDRLYQHDAAARPAASRCREIDDQRGLSAGHRRSRCRLRPQPAAIDQPASLRSSRPSERPMISRMISEVPAKMRLMRASVYMREMRYSSI